MVVALVSLYPSFAALCCHKIDAHACITADVATVVVHTRVSQPHGGGGDYADLWCPSAKTGGSRLDRGRPEVDCPPPLCDWLAAIRHHERLPAAWLVRGQVTWFGDTADSGVEEINDEAYIALAGLFTAAVSSAADHGELAVWCNTTYHCTKSLLCMTTFS